jgi:hypothetical protein
MVQMIKDYNKIIYLMKKNAKVAIHWVKEQLLNSAKLFLQNNEQLKIIKLIYLNNSQEMFNERAFEMCSTKRESERERMLI